MVVVYLWELYGFRYVVVAVDKENQLRCSHRADDARHEVAACWWRHPRSRVDPKIGVGFGCPIGTSSIVHAGQQPANMMFPLKHAVDTR